MRKGLVSIIIPTKNSSGVLQKSLPSIKEQTYKNIEIVVVDGKSTDNTIALAKQFHAKILTYVPQVPSGTFDASYKRNYGAKRAKGEYIYWMDADMELPKYLVAEAVKLCKQGYGAVILPEDSFGTGIWSRAKNLERRCYWGDDSVECPRFFKRSVWEEIGGLDESLGAGGDDLDIHQKVLERGHRVARTKSIVLHNEGNLTLGKLFRKHFMYGKDTIRYFYKRPKQSVISYFPVRVAYVKNIPLFLSRPIDAVLFVIMRSTEYTAGLLGLLSTLIPSKTMKKSSQMGIEEYARNLPQYYDDTIPDLLRKYLDTSTFKTLLDCGCGDGAFLFSLKRRGYFKNRIVYGIDLSKNRIRLVKKIDPTIHAYVDDATTLGTIRSNSIDFYISSYVIEHVDGKKMLYALSRVSRKHGTAYISTIFKKWYGWYYERKNGKWVMDVTHLREYTRDSELFDLIDKKKFAILESQKTQLYFPVIDFIIRRLYIKNRELYLDNSLLRVLRNIKVPIPGYYGWEVILRKRV